MGELWDFSTPPVLTPSVLKMWMPDCGLVGRYDMFNKAFVLDYVLVEFST